jgi:outer membrane protein assembly factor BamA
MLWGTEILAQSASTGPTVILSTDDSYTEPDTTAQQGYTIQNIEITGNRRTNPNVILREVNFQIGEAYSLEDLNHRFQKARKQLMNTGLFIQATISLKSMQGNDVYVSIEVLEKWYLWPQPFVKTVDKSINEWWTEKDRDMNRINYGIYITQNNFTGRNDKLKFNIMNGYTKQLALQYYGLFLDQKLRWSLNMGVVAGKNREVNYMTFDDKPVPIKDNGHFLRNYGAWFTEVAYRPAIKTKHTFGIAYSYEDFADTIFKLNPFFALRHQTMRFPELSYRLSYFDVDFIPYPTKGHILDISLRKKGFRAPVNLWQLTAKGQASWPINSNYFFTLSAVGQVKLPFRQPYYTSGFIGQDDQYLQGYEYYTIDGVAGGYGKASITRKVLSTHFSLAPRSIRQLHQIPLKIYAKTFVNTGYVYNTQPGFNTLDNKMLYSGGFGLDLVTFTDFVIKLEWSVNRLWENGLYLHKRGYF